MAITLPLPVRVAAGILAVGIDRMRALPADIPAIPVALVGNAMKLSMKVQQEIASLATKGDELLGTVLDSHEENPPWAKFDDEPKQPPVDKQAADTRAADRRTADTRSADKRTADTRSADGRAADQRAARKRSAATISTAAPTAVGLKRPAAASPEKPIINVDLGRPAGSTEPQAANQQAPDEQTADQGPADQPPVDQQAADQGTADQPLADQQAADQDTTGQPDADQPTADQDTTGQPAAEQTTDQVAAEQPTADEGATDQGATGQPAAGPTTLPGYDEMTLAQVRGHLRELSADEVSALLSYEQDGQGRAPFLTLLSNRLVTLAAGSQ